MFRWAQADQELDDELRDHVERKTEEYVRKGLPVEQARREALLEMGGLEKRKEECRDTRRVNLIQDLLQDLHYGVRVLRKSPGFAAIAVLTLALGIGANTAIFSLIDTVLLSPPAFKDLNRLTLIFDLNRKSVKSDFNIYPSPGNFVDWQKESYSFDQMSAWRNWYYSLSGAESGGSLPESVRGVRVSPSFFSMLGIDFAMGRGFHSDEEIPGHDQVVILSASLWKRRFGSDPNILGQKIRIDGRLFTVIGVLPAEFCFLQPDFEVWMPLTIDNDFPTRYDHSVLVFGRLAPGVSIAQAQAEMNSISAGLERVHPEANLGWETRIVPLYPSQYFNPAARSLRSALLILFGAVSMVLLIACGNVANLLLARSELRRKEIAVRIAIGAGRGRLIRQMLTESVVLAATGGALGLLLAHWCLRAITPLLPRITTYRFILPGIHAGVLGFTAGIAVLTGIVFGLPPALQVARIDSLRASATSPKGLRTGRLLMVSELALSIILLVGAASLLKSLWRLEKVNPGFRPDHLLTMQVCLPKMKYTDRSSISNFYQEVLHRLNGLPSVKTAAAVNFRPFVGISVATTLEVQGQPPRRPDEPPLVVEYRIATPGYLRTLGVPFLKGRDLSEADGPDAAGAVVVNETAARRLWPNEDPIGKQIRPKFGKSLSPWDAEADPSERWVTVVGVAGNIKEAGLNDREHAEIYLSYLQFPSSIMFLVVRAEVPPANLSSAARKAVLAVDPDQPVSDVRTMDSAIQDSTAAPRLSANLLGVFVLLAMFLSAAGVYGVMSYITSQRAQVNAIRRALGACPGDILIDILREMSALAAVAIASGLIASTWLTRAMKGLLFEATPIDPIISAGASALLLIVALTASYLPARRAMRVDPMVVLRHE